MKTYIWYRAGCVNVSLEGQKEGTLCQRAILHGPATVEINKRGVAWLPTCYIVTEGEVTKE